MYIDGESNGWYVAATLPTDFRIIEQKSIINAGFFIKLYVVLLLHIKTFAKTFGF